jgi:hypothetical protein
MHRTAWTTKNCPTPNVNCAEFEETSTWDIWVKSWDALNSLGILESISHCSLNVPVSTKSIQKTCRAVQEHLVPSSHPVEDVGSKRVSLGPCLRHSCDSHPISVESGPSKHHSTHFKVWGHSVELHKSLNSSLKEEWWFLSLQTPRSVNLFCLDVERPTAGQCVEIHAYFSLSLWEFQSCL